jgi:hypothetical protein
MPLAQRKRKIVGPRRIPFRRVFKPMYITTPIRRVIKRKPKPKTVQVGRGWLSKLVNVVKKGNKLLKDTKIISKVGALTGNKYAGAAANLGYGRRLRR